VALGRGCRLALVLFLKSRDQQQEGARKVPKKNSGPGMFDALTHDESWILSMKLMSGAAAVGRRPDPDYDTSREIRDVNADVQATWTQ
jgi:hypothetical protein